MARKLRVEFGAAELQSVFRPAIAAKLEPATVTVNLFGRDAELSIVRTHLRAGKNLAVCGPAGVGKTALVRAALAGRTNAVYCGDTATVKTARESLLAQLGLTVAEADNVQRRRAVGKCRLQMGTALAPIRVNQ